MTAGLLERMRDPRPLNPREARTVLDRLIAPATSEDLRVRLLADLSDRPTSAVELAALAAEMRRRAIRFQPSGARAAVDLCGSGGAPRPSFNVSTVSALVVAAAGVPVIKHGNRSSRGHCGSSDLLEALGLPVTSSLEFPRMTFRRHRIAFLHAPLFHPATRAVANARRDLGRPTVFNRLGPLSNPARVGTQVVGAVDRASARLFGASLGTLGVPRGLSMTSPEGCDEFSPVRANAAYAWTDRGHRWLTVHPERFLPPEDRRGPWGPLRPDAAAEATARLLAGGGGARRGSVLLTSGAALWRAGAADGLGSGVARATEALDAGRAERLLEDLRAIASEPGVRAAA